VKVSFGTLLCDWDARHGDRALRTNTALHPMQRTEFRRPSLVMVRGLRLKQVQNDLSVLGIVFIPGVVQGAARWRKRGEATSPLLLEEIRQRSLIVASGFKGSLTKSRGDCKRRASRCQSTMVLDTRHFLFSPLANSMRVIRILGHIDGYHQPFVIEVDPVIAGNLLSELLSTDAF
jgi:hypothetical protein